MKTNFRTLNVFSWIFGLAVLAIGVLNIILVHPVPGIGYLLLSALYFPPINGSFASKFGIRESFFMQIIMAIVILMFTLGLCDLADIMYDW